MKHAFNILLAFVLCLSACEPETPGFVVEPPVQEKPEEQPSQPEQPEEGGQPESGTKMPVMGERTMMKVDVEELSGLCLTLDKSALLATLRMDRK